MNCIETERGKVVTRDCREGNQELLFNGCRASICKMESTLEIGGMAM